MKKILMPESLTAENGAKALLIGEFKEYISVDCPQCGGSGEDECDEGESCFFCKGMGCVEEPVDVSWTTIKAIYKMAAKHLGEKA